MRSGPAPEPVVDRLIAQGARRQTGPFALMKLLPFVGDQAVAAMEQPSGAPTRAAATAVGVVTGQKLAGFLAGSQQSGPAASAAFSRLRNAGSNTSRRSRFAATRAVSTS